MPHLLFINTASEWVDHLPDDTDGMKIYKIKSLPREWVKRIHDLRYFKINSSRRKGIIGMTKIGRCTGNLYYLYDEFCK